MHLGKGDVPQLELGDVLRVLGATKPQLSHILSYQLEV